MEAAKLSLHHIIREPKNAFFRSPVLILLHGEESNEDQLFGLAPGFDDRLMVIAVRAPFSKTNVSYQWYEIDRKWTNSLINSVELNFSIQAIANFIQEIIQSYDVDSSQIYLFGFDQGAVITLGMVFAKPEIVSGAVLVSGDLPNEIRPLTIPGKKLREFPLVMVHGIHDEITPIAKGRALRDTLNSYFINLTYREYPMGHFVVYDSLEDIQAWLTARLNIKMTGALTQPSTKVPVGKVKIGHVQLKVRDLDRSISFYQRFLGFRLTERAGNTYAFLVSQNNPHHELALQKVNESALTPGIDSTGLFHVAFEAPDQIAFATIYKNLVDAKVRITTTDHTICWSMYFTDPEGNGLEVYWDTRDLPGKSPLWQGKDLPLSPEKILEVLEK